MLKQRFARLVVRRHKQILIAMGLLTLLSATQIGNVNINYDLTKYLNRNTMTRRSLQTMQEEFGLNEQLQMLFIGEDDAEIRTHVETLSSTPGILLASYDPNRDQTTAAGESLRTVQLTLTDGDAVAMVRRLQADFADVNCLVTGSAADMVEAQRNIGTEIPLALAVSVGIVAVVLLLTSKAYLEVPIILTVLASAILINMGTNWIFPSVSFVTFAVCAILQLALSMDYGIMLIHAFHTRKETGESDEAAMTAALTETLMPILSSGLTTVAGLLSLLVMSFTIGFDIGLALSKGILISIPSVFLLMPALILLLARPLQRSRHTALPLGGRVLGRLCYRTRRVTPFVLLLAAGVACYLQAGNTYIFTEQGNTAVPMREEVHAEESNTVVVLLPSRHEEADFDRQRALAAELMALSLDDRPLVRSLSSMVTTGDMTLRQLSRQDVAELLGISPIVSTLFFAQAGITEKTVRADALIEKAVQLYPDNESLRTLNDQVQLAKSSFLGNRYDRMILELSSGRETRENNRAVQVLLDTLHAAYGEDIGLTGEAVSSYDISNAFTSDLARVTVLTLIAIWLVVALAFRSVRMPWLLVLVIQGAIFITMAISRIMGQPIFFISYLICMALQMGATIDYAILLATHYRSLRRELPREEALPAALHAALPTILTSGTILISAGYVVGRLCSIYYISSIGLLLSRGALISVIMVLTLLPTLLVLLDRWIVGKAGKRA